MIGAMSYAPRLRALGLGVGLVACLLAACFVDEVTFKAAAQPAEDCAAPGDEDGNGAADCEDAACAAEPQCAPAPATCTDGQKNGAETDVDCGGGSCPACGLGQACEQKRDCGANRMCDAKLCRAALSCADLLAEYPGAADGVYPIAPSASLAPFNVYCDMTRGGGGWTLLLKANDQNVFALTSAAWTDDSVFQPDDLTLAGTNAKYMSFNTLPVTALRGELDGYLFQQTFNLMTARQVFGGPAAFVQPYPFFNTGGANWSTQPNCQSYGVNIAYAGNARGIHVRFGWTANQEANCDSNDTIIGLGAGARGAGYACTSSNCSAGNVSVGGIGRLWGR